VMVFSVLITAVFIVNNISRVLSLIFHQPVKLGEWSPASENYIHIKERGQ
jgi:branched-subunit amino acid transport protein